LHWDEKGRTATGRSRAVPLPGERRPPARAGRRGGNKSREARWEQDSVPENEMGIESFFG
jgi:hypothetical protein